MFTFRNDTCDNRPHVATFQPCAMTEAAFFPPSSSRYQKPTSAATLAAFTWRRPWCQRCTESSRTPTMRWGHNCSQGSWAKSVFSSRKCVGCDSHHVVPVGSEHGTDTQRCLQATLKHRHTVLWESVRDGHGATSFTCEMTQCVVFICSHSFLNICCWC